MQNKSIVPLPGEVWKDISWTDGIYQVSSFGRVRRTQGWSGYRACIVLSPKRTPKGYLQVRLKWNGHERRLETHTVVMEMFNGPRPRGLVINHKDGIKTNNDWRNLEYVTIRENNVHAIRTGLRPSYAIHRVKRPGCVSRFIGVHRRKQRWVAQIIFNGKRKYIGSFSREEEAAQAYLDFRNAAILRTRGFPLCHFSPHGSRRFADGDAAVPLSGQNPHP